MTLARTLGLLCLLFYRTVRKRIQHPFRSLQLLVFCGSSGHLRCTSRPNDMLVCWLRTIMKPPGQKNHLDSSSRGCCITLFTEAVRIKKYAYWQPKSYSRRRHCPCSSVCPYQSKAYCSIGSVPKHPTFVVGGRRRSRQQGQSQKVDRFYQRARCCREASSSFG